MATTLAQKPLYSILPVGQEVIFAVTNAPIVSAYTRVKMIAEVYISDIPIVIASSSPIGTFKTTPNNTGTAIFDLSTIVESYVKSDNLAAVGSEYKGTATSATVSHPLHLIDAYSINDNVVRYLKVRFTTEYLDTSATPVVIVTDGTEVISSEFTLFNGYLKYTDKINISSSDFGFDTTVFQLNPVAVFGDVVGRFITNAPMTQYANKGDYGTISMLTNLTTAADELDFVTFKYYGDSGQIGSPETISRSLANGAFDTNSGNTKDQILHLGCYPANIRNWSSTFRGLIDSETVTYYTVSLHNAAGAVVSFVLTINVLCPTLKGYEPIRVTWINQWGVWDYYTFNMKSIKSISTKGSTYQQQAGTWNESTYRADSYKGGKKAFRVNAMEKITMNTDFVNESESEWFEEFINSPEAYILDVYQTDVATAALNTYVTPVRLTTSSFTKKTIANDKLMQYTFEVEKSKTLRTQAV